MSPAVPGREADLAHSASPHCFEAEPEHPLGPAFPLSLGKEARNEKEAGVDLERRRALE